MTYDAWKTSPPEPPPPACEWCNEAPALPEGLCGPCFDARQAEIEAGVSVVKNPVNPSCVVIDPEAPE